MPIIVEAPKPMVHLTESSTSHNKLVFFGTPSFSAGVLRALVAAGWPIATVVTAPDKPTGRTQALTASPVKRTAQELGLPVRTPEKLDDAFFMEFEHTNPDVCVVVAYGKIIPKRFLAVPRLGMLNVHPSLLPKYRGPSPLQTAILNGDTQTGISIMLLDEGMDTGPILAQAPWAIPSGFDNAAAHDEAFRIGTDLLLKTLGEYVAGKVTSQSQDNDGATVTKKFTTADGKIDWSQSAHQIANRIRALGENPGTWTMWDGKKLRIFSAQPEDASGGAVGTVLLHNGQLAVACGSGVLMIEELQLEGGNRMSARDFLNGRSAIIGEILT